MASATRFCTLKCSNPIIEEMFRDGHVNLEDGTKKALDVYVPREEGDHLYSIVRHLQPELTIEVGMANGSSSLFIAQALKDNGHGSHIAIDPFQSSDWAGAGMAALRRAGTGGQRPRSRLRRSSRNRCVGASTTIRPTVPGIGH